MLYFVIASNGMISQNGRLNYGTNAMNNTLRFRAWHKKIGIMVPVTELLLHEDIIGVEFHDIFIWDFEDIVLMQWTQYKDIKGVDVYIDDILKQDDTYFHINSLETFYSLKDRYFGFPKQAEVIGNLYEHPEIIKEISSAT